MNIVSVYRRLGFNSNLPMVLMAEGALASPTVLGLALHCVLLCSQK